MIKLECKTRDNMLRFRGIPEDKDENISEMLVRKIAELLGEPPKDLNFNFNSVYRVNSNYALQKKLPRDVVAQVTSKKLKEDILNKTYKEPLEWEGKKIKILKELPREVINRRKNYKPLTEKLKNYKIRFRWEIPEGLSFFLKGTRRNVMNLEKMKEVLQEFSRETVTKEKGSLKDNHGS